MHELRIDAFYGFKLARRITANLSIKLARGEYRDIDIAIDTVITIVRDFQSKKTVFLAFYKIVELDITIIIGGESIARFIECTVATGCGRPATRSCGRLFLHDEVYSISIVIHLSITTISGRKSHIDIIVFLR